VVVEPPPRSLNGLWMFALGAATSALAIAAAMWVLNR
jgi:hypothetical protein